MRVVPLKNRVSRLVAVVFCVVMMIALWLLAGNQNAAPVMASADSESDRYIVLAWSDKGMHYYDADYRYMVLAPPYNSLYAQVIRLGNPPEIITTGITLTYEFVDNSYSVGKSNFWDYDVHLFGVDLLPNVGLTGKGMTGTLDLREDAWIAEGIPLTHFRDSDYEAEQENADPSPYQLAIVRVYDSNTNELLAETTTVAPASSELHCENSGCHADGGVGNVSTGDVGLNILTLHDRQNANKYPREYSDTLVENAPVLCAECHASEALGEEGMAGMDSMSYVIHDTHAYRIWLIQPPIAGCYQCHPGTDTQCLRGVMSHEYGMNCTHCHGTIYDVADKESPWLDEPRCDDAGCHDDGLHDQNEVMFRDSSNHGDVRCSGCHDSVHAITPSREDNDAIKFMDLQGANDVIGFGSRCYVCHTGLTDGTGPHETTVNYIVLPLIVRQ